MKVFINNQEIELFLGARVEDAVRRYLRLKELSDVNLKSVLVRDAWGNEIDLDGALSDGAKIFVENL